jgi:hypothetical protein
MLEGVDEVDWKRFARGVKPLDIPKLLRGLASDDTQTRKNACHTLEFHLEHYQSIDDVLGNDLLITMAPFFIELLGCPHVQDKALITGFLWTMVYLADLSLQEPYRTRAVNLKEAVCKGTEVYVSLLFDETALDVQQSVIFLLSKCSDEKENTIGAILLFQLTANNNHPGTTTELIQTLGDIIKSCDSISAKLKERYIQQLKEFLASSDHVEIRGMAALYLVEFLKLDAPHDTDDALERMMPLLDNRPLLRQFCQALEYLGEPRGIPILMSAIKTRESKRSTCVALLAILDIVFSEDVLSSHDVASLSTYHYNVDSQPEKMRVYTQAPPPRVDPYVVYNPAHIDEEPFSPPEQLRRTFTDSQRSVLRQLLDLDNVWDFETNLFRFYGLPHSRTGIRELIDA